MGTEIGAIRSHKNAIGVRIGPKPLPRKVVITYKESAGHPEYTSFLSNWNLSADVPDSAFVAQVPAGAKKVEFGPAREPPPQK